ncbi:hypothetical protein SLS58_002712 [Diplodia intermedia]|uniref:Rhodopsin domain-containing protein n=1 Tax=Diplodia intermedia TaxID=856260 RepID=A0ABR3TYA7_9PEZI
MGIQTHVEDLEPVSWALMALAILLVIVRLTIRYTATRELRTEDIMVGAAMLMDIGATVALALAVQLGGLGKHQVTLTQKQNDARTKANYVQHLLYIAVIATAKISMTIFFQRLAVKKIHHRITWALAVIIALWAFSSEFVVAFQCPMPHPWDPTAYPAGSCLPEKIWLYVTVVDCLTEALIMALPFWIIWNVRIPRRKKWLIQTLFAFRIVYVPRHTQNPAPFDTSYDQTGYWLWTDLHSTIAIIAACIPALKPFLEWSAGRIAGTISSSSGANAGSTGAAAAYAAYAVDRRSSRATRSRGYSGCGDGADADGKVYRMRAFSGGAAGGKTGGRVTDRAVRDGGGGGGGGDDDDDDDDDDGVTRERSSRESVAESEVGIISAGGGGGSQKAEWGEAEAEASSDGCSHMSPTRRTADDYDVGGERGLHAL